MLDTMVDRSYQLTVGPLLIGVVVNAFVFGVCIVQLVAYASSRFKDNWWIIGMLVWMYAIDAFQVCGSVSMLWQYVVVNFGIPSALSSAPWEYATLPIFSSIAPVPIQQFMAYRIMRFSGSRFLFFLVSVLSLLQASLACASAAQGLTHTALSSGITIVPVAAAWIVFGITCDISVTVLLMYYLLKNRTGFEGTDSIILKICSTLIKAAVPVTVLCTTDLCLLITMPGNNLHYMFALPVGRLYTCTLMSTLNGRKHLRAQLENPRISQQGINLPPLYQKRRLQRDRAQVRIYRAQLQIEIENALEDSTSVDLDLESVHDKPRKLVIDSEVDLPLRMPPGFDRA